MSERGVSRFNQYNGYLRVGLGYIFLPPKVDREEYIKTCYRKMRVPMVINEGGAMVKSCYITKEALNNITFSDKNGGLGSPVVYISPPVNDVPIIIGVIPTEKEVNPLDAGEFYLSRLAEGIFLSVNGDIKNKLLSLLSLGTESPTQILIRAIGLNQSEVNIESDKNVNLNGRSQVNVEARASINLNVKNSNEDSELKTIFIDNNYIWLQRGDDQIIIAPDNINIIQKTEDIDEDGNPIYNNINLNKKGGITINRGMDTVISILKEAISIQRKEDSIVLDDNHIHLQTENTVDVNGGSEFTALGETLKNKLDELENQILLIKNILSNASTTTPSGTDSASNYKTNIALGLASMNPIDFSGVIAKKLKTD